MSWYRAGTISLTNGNATVTGTGTAWIANASVGEGFVAPDGRIYEITGIASDTSLTISPAYLGSTASGQGYAIAPLRGRIAQLLSETSSLLASFATVRDGIGAGLFPDGTVALPAFRFAADQDTGFRRAAANTLAMVTGGVDRSVVGAFGLSVPGVTAASPPALGATPTDFSVGPLAAYGMSLGTISDGSGYIQQQRFDGGTIAYNLLLQPRGGNVGIGTNLVTPLFGRTVQIGAGDIASTLSLVGTSGSGFIATNGALFLVTARTGMALSLGAGEVEQVRITTSGTVRPGADNTQNLGEASFRWSTVFAGTGTINTSDEREKVWRGPMNEAEMRAAKRLIGELGMFQFIESVDEKGEEARLHFGVRAQAAFAILKEEGLDWWRYAWCCYDKWDEITEPVMEEVTVEKTHTVTREQTDPETGETTQIEIEETYEETEQRDTGEVRIVREAGDRYGIRSDQLAFWLIAAQAEIQSDLDARLAKLEGKRK